MRLNSTVRQMVNALDSFSFRTVVLSAANRLALILKLSAPTAEGRKSAFAFPGSGEPDAEIVLTRQDFSKESLLWMSQSVCFRQKVVPDAVSLPSRFGAGS
jgi:hypothetical protein